MFLRNMGKKVEKLEIKLKNVIKQRSQITLNLDRKSVASVWRYEFPPDSGLLPYEAVWDNLNRQAVKKI